MVPAALTQVSAAPQTEPFKYDPAADYQAVVKTTRGDFRLIERGFNVVALSGELSQSARNHALRLSRGDYVQFLDADDLLAPNKLAQQMELAAVIGADGGIAGFTPIRESTTV